MDGRTVLVDVSHLIRIKWATHPTTMVQEVKDWLMDLAEAYEGNIYICLDSPPYARCEIAPEYKANRAEKEPELVAATEECKAMFHRVFPGRVLAVPKAEADDVIATVVWGGKQGFDVYSSDKDLFSLVGLNGCRVISPRTSEMLQSEEDVKKKLGVYPGQVASFIALAGDKADGIPGAKGIGEVGARKLLEEFGGVTEVLAQADMQERGNSTMDPKLASLVRASRVSIVASATLAELVTNLPIELDDIEPWGGPPEAASSRRPVTKSSEPGPEPPETPPVYRDTGSRLNIFQRLREVMKDVPGIKKGTRHQQGYDYTGHEALTHALRPAYIRHGIVRTVSVIGSEYTGEHKDVLELTAVVRWTNVDDPTDFHEVTSIGIAPPTVTKDWTDNKTGVVTPGKRMMVPTQSGVATSYAQKNAEFKALCITGDDTPDAEEWS